MPHAPRTHRLSLGAISLLALATTGASAATLIVVLRRAGEDWHWLPLLGAALLASLVLALPLRGRWRARRDGARVGLAWTLALPLALLLCVPVYGVPYGIALPFISPLLGAVAWVVVGVHAWALLRARGSRALLSDAERRAWDGGVAVPTIVLLLAVAPAFTGPTGPPHPPQPSLAAGVGALRRLGACARAWTATHPDDAPGDLAALRTDPRCRVDAPGWRLEYVRDPSRVAGFDLVAREPAPPLIARHSLVVTEQGVVHVADGKEDAQTSDPALTVVPRELARIRECIDAVVAARPGHELPRSLAELGADGEGCDVLAGASWSEGAAMLTVRFTARDAVDERYRFTYEVVTDSAGTRLPRVDARPVRYPEDGVRGYALVGDSLRATADDRAVRADDPLVDDCETGEARGACGAPAGWVIVSRPGVASARPDGPVLPARDSLVRWAAPLGSGPAGGASLRPGAPAIGADSAVYAGTPGGVYAFDGTGRHRWARPDLPLVEEGGVAVVGDEVLAPTRDSGLVALDPLTGETRWGSRAVAGALAFAPLALPGGAVAIANRTGALSVFEHHGQLRWTRRFGTALLSAPIADARGTMYALVDGKETQLVAIGPDGAERRRVRVEGWRTPPALLADGAVLVASGAGVFAVDMRGGPVRKLAASATDADRVVVRGDGSFVFSDAGRLTAMAANGRSLWSAQPASSGVPLSGPVALPDGSVIVSDGARIRVVSAAGDSLWSASYARAAAPASAAVGPDGTIYVADTRWRITAIRKE